MSVVFRAGPKPPFCYVVRVEHRIIHGGIADDLARARAEYRRKWPDGELVQVGVGMTQRSAEEWARRNGYIK